MAVKKDVHVENNTKENKWEGLARNIIKTMWINIIRDN